MLRVVLTSFFFIILAELVSLLGQLVFCTYALFGTLKIHYECGRVVKALDSESDVRALWVQVPSPTIFFSMLAFFVLNCNIHDIFFFSSLHLINRVIDFIYILYNRKSPLE